MTDVKEFCMQRGGRYDFAVSKYYVSFAGQFASEFPEGVKLFENTFFCGLTIFYIPFDLK